MSYDAECEKLANYFLLDLEERHKRSLTDTELSAELAQAIQDTIEDFLNRANLT